MDTIVSNTTDADVGPCGFDRACGQQLAALSGALYFKNLEVSNDDLDDAPAHSVPGLSYNHQNKSKQSVKLQNKTLK